MKHDYIETHLEKHEYIEGPQALANFNRVATAVFQSKKKVVPVAVAPLKDVPKKRVSRRKPGKGRLRVIPLAPSLSRLAGEVGPSCQ